MHLRGNLFIKTLFILIFAAFTISGCGGRLFTFKGDRVTQKDLMVQLEDGDQQGAWKTNEVMINYQYQKMPEGLKILGSVELVGGFAIGFNSISRLAVYLLFLDDQGIVVENVLIYSLGDHYSTNMIPIIFERTTPIPKGVRTISFAYDGVLDGSYDIWSSPSRQ